jgi:hypothetical protein
MRATLRSGDAGPAVNGEMIMPFSRLFRLPVYDHPRRAVIRLGPNCVAGRPCPKGQAPLRQVFDVKN